MTEPVTTYSCPNCGKTYETEDECKAHISFCDGIRAEREALVGRWAEGNHGGITAIGRIDSVTGNGVWIQGLVVSECFGRFSLDKMPQVFAFGDVQVFESVADARKRWHLTVKDVADHLLETSILGVDE